MGTLWLCILVPSRARRAFVLVVSIRQHTQAEAHTRSQTRGVRATEELRARCSYLIPAPQGSTRQYEYFSSLALTCTFSGVVFDGGHYWSALRGVVHWAPPPAGAYCCKKREKEKEKFGKNLAKFYKILTKFWQNLQNFEKFSK